MKRRTFLKGLTAFIAAPLAVLGAKKVAKPEIRVESSCLIDSDSWFLSSSPRTIWVPPSLEKEARAILGNNQTSDLTEESMWAAMERFERAK